MVIDLHRKKKTIKLLEKKWQIPSYRRGKDFFTHCKAVWLSKINELDFIKIKSFWWRQHWGRRYNLYPNCIKCLKLNVRDVCGGPVLETPLPASAGDTGSIPGPGGSHVPRGSWGRAAQLRDHAPQPRGDRSGKPALWVENGRHMATQTQRCWRWKFKPNFKMNEYSQRRLRNDACMALHTKKVKCHGQLSGK